MSGKLRLDFRLSNEEADALTRTHTAFSNFEALLCAPGYRPSINVFSDGAKRLADAYDAAQASRKDNRRVQRYRREPLRRVEGRAA